MKQVFSASTHDAGEQRAWEAEKYRAGFLA